jgi:para-nitrobenzyl esterase
MARRGIVALTVNYRLNIFGFFAHPELTKESPHHASGNDGLLDQVASLEWVRRNIAAFGGDPSRVTIAGESAGSIAVHALMASPLSKGLIAGAIGESGAMIKPTLPPVPLADGEKTGLAIASSLGVSSLQALRGLPADQVLQITAKQGGGPFNIATIDGYFLPKAPVDIFAAGEQARVPLLAGWNSQEQAAGAVLGRGGSSIDSYTQAVQRLFGDASAGVLKAYPAPTPADVERAATDLASDRFIAYSTWKWTDQHARTGGKPVYRYFYLRPRPAAVAAAPGAGSVAHGAVHSAEIEYAMGNLATNKVFAWTDDDYKVSAAMQGYFANFVKTGNPNGAGLPTWAALRSRPTPQVMLLDVEPRLQPDVRESRYAVLDGIYQKY